MSEQAIAEVPQATEAKAKDNLYLSVGLFSLLVLVSFFLPWIVFLGRSVSGFNIVQIEDFGNNRGLVLCIPLAALVSLTAAMTRSKNTREIGTSCACIPFLALAFFCIKGGLDLFQILGAGAYLTLFASLVLAGTCLKRANSKG